MYETNLVFEQKLLYLVCRTERVAELLLANTRFCAER